MNARSWLAGAAALTALVAGSLLLPEPPAVSATDPPARSHTP
ncbi:hypothetical protein ABFT23_05155 [Nocardioides sp. C4-1]